MKPFFSLGAALILCLCVCRGAVAQSKAAFEAVSIKPVPAPTPQSRQAAPFRPAFNVDNSRVEITGFTLSVILARAFRVGLEQIDAPDFVKSAYFEVRGKLSEGSTSGQVPEMLQTMLAERFGLVVHRDAREYPTTVVTVGKGGMKLQRLPNDTPFTPQKRESLPDGSTRITQIGKMSSLYPVMNSFGGFPTTVDETGLDGIYTWVLNQAPASPGETFQDVVHASYQMMFDAAGLKLETRKVAKETIVVDHLEKTPTEN